MSARRRLWGLGALACAALLGFGYYLQYAQGQEPCPLCLVQRGFYYGLLVVFLAAAIHAPARAGTMAYGVAAFALALGGAGVAGRQVWLQHLPPEQVPPCGPGLEYMLENLPLAQTLAKLFTGSGQCAEVTWRFLGLSIAGWSLAWFAGLALYAGWLALRRR